MYKGDKKRFYREREILVGDESKSTQISTKGREPIIVQRMKDLKRLKFQNFKWSKLKQETVQVRVSQVQSRRGQCKPANPNQPILILRYANHYFKLQTGLSFSKLQTFYCHLFCLASSQLGLWFICENLDVDHVYYGKLASSISKLTLHRHLWSVMASLYFIWAHDEITNSRKIVHHHQSYEEN